MEETPRCPPREDLEGFHGGLLSEPQAVLLAQHLEDCTTCLAALETLPVTDPVLVGLRGPGPPADLAAGVDLAELQQRCKQGLLEEKARLTPTVTAATEAEPLPARIGRYQVESRVGAGGMGVVYRSFDPELRRPVAIKVPRLGTAHADPALHARFLREARAAARVRHPYLCPIHDAGECAGRPYVVMEFIDGESLQERLRRGGYQDARAAALLVLQVAQALQAVHDEGITHRDLKPGNILLDRAGRPHLADFGLARAAGDSERLTAEGVIAGTPAYLAPEQIDPAVGTPGPASDVYSLGVVLFEMLAGKLPYSGPALFQQIRDGIPPDLASLRSDLPPALVALVARAMARDPAERFASAGALAAALDAWLGGAPTALDAVRPARSRRRWPLLAGSAVVAACLLLALTVRWTGTEAPAHRPDAAPASPALEPPRGVLDVLIWDKDSRQRQNVRLRDESALPLRAGDLVRIEAVLTRPAHAYLFLIETTGTVTPLFPWLGGDWSKPPVEDLPRDLLSLPEQRTAAGELGGFEVAGARGMETLVLALRDSPLPPSFDLPGLLAGLPPQREQDLHALVWFDNGLVKRDDLSRGFASFNPQRIDDPVLQTQDVLRRRLRRDFVFFTAVSYALQGDEAKGTPR